MVKYFEILFLFFGVLLALEQMVIWNDSRGERKVFFGIVNTLLLIAISGFILANLGKFTKISILVAEMIWIIAFGIYIVKKKVFEWQWIKEIYVNPLIIILFILMIHLFWVYPSMNIYGGRDEGLYFLQGIHIAEEASVLYEDDIWTNENHEEIAGWCERGYLGLYSKYDYGLSTKEGAREFQFMSFFPTILAIGYLLAGIPLMIRMNGIIAILSILCIYCYIKDYIGEKYRAFLSCLLIVLSPAFLWNGRATFSEITTQFLFFYAVYIYSKGWESCNRVNAVFTSILIGIALMTRIDALIWGIGIISTGIWILLFEKEKVRYISSLIFSYLVVLMIVSIYCLSYNYVYIYEHRKYLVALICIQFLLICIWGVIYLIRQEKKELKNLLTMKTVQRMLPIVYWCVLLAIPLVMYRVEGNTFRARAAYEFSWYTCILPLIFVPIGIRNILNNNIGDINRNVLFLLTAGSVFLVYIINPSISEDHIWASRRWVLLGIPFVMICFANCFGLFGNYVKKFFYVITMAFTFSYLLNQDSVFLTTRILEGIDKQYDTLADELDDEKIYFTASTRLATTLRFVYGKNVYYIDVSHFIPNGKTEEVIPELSSYLEKNKLTIYYIGSEDDMRSDKLQYKQISNYQIQGLDLEKVKREFPKQLVTLEIPANIYEIDVRH